MTPSARIRRVWPALAALAAAALPLLPVNQYQIHLATLVAVYWVLIAGLNLVVGYAGQLSIGHVGLLAIGAYAYAVLAGTYEWSPLLALVVASGAGGLCGLLLGLPALRLPGFYFAMATLAFSLIVGELSLALDGITGGGTGLSVPGFPAPFDTPAGLYWLVLGVALLVTWLSWNVARQMWGRALLAVRDSPVAAVGAGISLFRAKLTVFVFSGVTAGLAGGLFAALQSYITPDTFAFDIGLFFFVCIIIGGRGSILGPLLGTVVLTILPDAVAPLARLGNFFYGLLLLVVVLVLPEGIGPLLGAVAARFGRRGQHESHVVNPDLSRLRAVLAAGPQG
jgi:ABC-type branched-subunit amino acid transport system permease subunit